jgi:hypothetical protein
MRYAVQCGKRWVAAIHRDDDGVLPLVSLTAKKEDAATWPTSVAAADACYTACRVLNAGADVVPVLEYVVPEQNETLGAAELETAFREWWAESYPNIPPNSRTVDSHVAFAQHVLQLAEVMEEYSA